MQTIHEPKQANKQTYKNHFPLPLGKMSNVNWREGSRSTGTERVAAASRSQRNFKRKFQIKTKRRRSVAVAVTVSAYSDAHSLRFGQLAALCLSASRKYVKRSDRVGERASLPQLMALSLSKAFHACVCACVSMK